MSQIKLPPHEDPDGDDIEVAAWWDVDDLPGMPALREEARSTDWEVLRQALQPAVVRMLEKALRHVRTPEGVEQYDQPIGSVIRPDVIPDLAVATIDRDPDVAVERVPVPVRTTTPKGTAGSALLNQADVPAKSRMAVATAMAAVAKVHGLGGTTVRQGLSVKPLRAKSTHGQLVIQGSFPQHIALRSTSDHPSLTVVHEYGHLLDWALIGPQWKFATESWPLTDPGADPAVQRVVQALVDSNASKNIQDSPNITAGSKSYLLRRHERFARAYAQYVAIRSQDPTLLAELDAQRGKGQYEQWEDRDFEPIADAFDNLFRDLGWIE